MFTHCKCTSCSCLHAYFCVYLLYVYTLFLPTCIFYVYLLYAYTLFLPTCIFYVYLLYVYTLFLPTCIFLCLLIVRVHVVLTYMHIFVFTYCICKLPIFLLQLSNDKSITAFPDEENTFKWTGKIKGPIDSVS